MKKLLKRFICIVLTIILLFSTISVNAYTSHSAAEAVSWANSLIGKSVDYDGEYGAQCVDLIAYYYQYLGTQTPGGSAYKYATNKLPDGWNRIPYYNGFVAQPGDIAVWTYAASNSGHVAIVTSADEYGMNVVDQNGQSSPAHIVKSTSFKYSYGTFYGVIRPDFDRIPPEISNVTVSNKTSNGYTVTCKVSDDVCVTQVKCPTWNEADGFDNCIWYDAVNNGDGTWTFTFIDALKPGNYITHIYAYDAVGNYSSKSIKAQTISKNLSKPTIKSTDIISGKKISISSKENADIYYKLSKKGKYKKYSAPFNISSTKTIYAYAKSKGCKNSKTSIKKVSLAKLSKPSRLKAKSIKSASVNLTWSKVKGASEYIVMYTQNGKSTSKAVKTKSNSVTIKNLKPNKKYSFKVCATAVGKQASNYSKSVSVTTKKSNKSTKKYKTTIENRINSGEWFNLESCIFPGDAIQILKFNNGSVTVKTTGNEAEVVDKHKYTVINDSSVKFTYTIKNYDTVTCTISIIDGSKLLKVKYYYKKHAETYYSLLTSEEYSGPNVTNTPIANTFYNNYWHSDYFDNKYLTFQCITVHGIDEETAYIAVNRGGYYAYTPLISKSLASFSLQEDDIFISAIIEYVGDNNSLNAFIFEDQNEPIMEKWVLI